MKNLARALLASSVALALSACAKSEETKADTSSITTSSSTAPSQPELGGAAPAPVTPPGPANPSSPWVVTAHGIGNLRTGMTVEEARDAYPAFRVPASRDTAACTYAVLNGWPAGLGVMVEGGRVVRVEVRRGNFETSTGARIGDTEEKIQTLYPGQVTVSPHKYTDGHYLTVTPTAEGDSANRIIFETDGRRVVNYRAGIRPQIEYVEGCS